MSDISVDSTLEPLLDALDGLSGRRMAAIVASSLTAVAAEAQKAFQESVSNVFDNPTPFTANSVFVNRATAETLTAVVGFKETGAGIPAGKYLQAELFGGERADKRFEKALIARGILQSGWQATPGPGASLDSYGNQSNSQITDILASLQNSTDGDGSKVAKRREKLAVKRGAAPTKYFFVKVGDASSLKPGIYQRQTQGHGGRINKVVNFVPTTHYDARFNMDAIVTRVIVDKFQAIFIYYAEASINRLLAKQSK